MTWLGLKDKYEQDDDSEGGFWGKSLLYTNIWVCMQFDILESISVFNGARIHVCVQSISCYVGMEIFSYLYSTCECLQLSYIIVHSLSSLHQLREDISCSLEWCLILLLTASIVNHSAECVIAKVKVAQSSDSLGPHGLYGLYSQWNSPGQNTGGGSLSLLQPIFPTQGSDPGIQPRSPALQADSSPAEPQGSPKCVRSPQ